MLIKLEQGSTGACLVMEKQAHQTTRANLGLGLNPTNLPQSPLQFLRTPLITLATSNLGVIPIGMFIMLEKLRSLITQYPINILYINVQSIRKLFNNNLSINSLSINHWPINILPIHTGTRFLRPFSILQDMKPTDLLSLREINTAKENIHSTEVKNNGKARKYVEIGDDEKHPHYKLLPDDLHPEYVDHLSLPADLLEGIYDDIHKTDKVQNNEILKESPKNPVNNVENILESNQKNPEAMEGNAIHSEIQSKSDLDDHEQKSHIPEITSPSKQKDMSVEEKQDQSKGFLAHNGKLYIHNMAGGGVHMD
ncbi:uncharacterized protein PGTG_08953 [Puccinia graminis f. sp. tritici CRL 75-36-700-3]|uniref:Uncharacterized protein n=1 Tax=Puccinia graminis f. sp. tritici (strain CRL 75-36-700-3 / race SCCL) TaxID=418459 RepID=E3KEQ3_PUCGT|nr:uncharacterized protein PGTG_08953 [Puccinia graminis f. sp. tritici CRL 75-36-700-3]EFP82757.2 hypothetical protein PGTG_08953 [Puccinia graminis f. sp. tritici CRL 75-36-700-3]